MKIKKNTIRFAKKKKKTSKKKYFFYLFLASVALLDWPFPYNDVVDAIHLARVHWQSRPLFITKKKVKMNKKQLSLLNSTFFLKKKASVRHTNENFSPKDCLSFEHVLKTNLQ